MIGAAIKAHLIASTVTAIYLQGLSGAPDRVYPLIIPQKTPRGPARVPGVVYGRTAVDRQKLYCGTSGTVYTRIPLDCYDTSPEGAELLGNAVKDALQDFRGLLGAIVRVKDTTLESEIDLQDIEPGIFRVSQSWGIWHLE